MDLGSGDVGVLNYAYALEQLEAAFYYQVLAGAHFSGAPADEQAILTDIMNHEVIHHDFLRAARHGRHRRSGGGLHQCELRRSGERAGCREDVRGPRRRGLQWRGQAPHGPEQPPRRRQNRLSGSPPHLSIRDLLQPASFAASDVVDANGLDGALDPTAVLTAADTYVVTTINVSNLPTS